MFLLKECAWSHVSVILWSLSPALRCSAPPVRSSFLISPVVFVRVSMGVCSAWAVGGVVVMESVLRDLWAGLQDAEPELCERERGPGMPTAWDADQTLQHSRVSWLVASPISLSLSLHLCLQHVWFFFFFFFRTSTPYFQFWEQQQLKRWRRPMSEPELECFYVCFCGIPLGAQRWSFTSSCSALFSPPPPPTSSSFCGKPLKPKPAS